MNAPNTHGCEITREGPYHNITKGTVDCGDHSPARCRKCKAIPDNSHVVNGPRDSLRVFCDAHCPTCLALRKAAA